MLARACADGRRTTCARVAAARLPRPRIGPALGLVVALLLTMFVVAAQTAALGAPTPAAASPGAAHSTAASPTSPTRAAPALPPPFSRATGRPPSATKMPGFAGTAVCGGCHAAALAAWRGSHHDLAMSEATEGSVLGDFADATFTAGGVESRFFRRDGGYFVHTDGPDGRPADFRIAYTFGVYPLQQYLIAFPDGRLQALGIAWDSRPKESGGQRWFHLYADHPPKAGEPVHWTGIDQTWNYMCAECHSTELRKNYDAAANTYATTWAEIDVACESCHGPGAAHVAWAESRKAGANGRRAGADGDRRSPEPGDDGLSVHFDERDGVHWAPDPATGKPRRSSPRTTAKEVETCGVCHSLGTKIAEPWRPGHPLLDSHIPSLLEPGQFEADGNSLGEVYNWAPFRQSRMFHAGVTCSDCHDPHSLKRVVDGDAVCEQCHESGRYAVAEHHHHADGSAGARCVSCHMPIKTYMQVDPRHDHAFRIPRPDESVRFGTSNACTDCHRDKDAKWAAAAVEGWYGPRHEGFQTWTETFAAVRDGKPEAARLLLALALDENAPAIVRASALDDLAAFPGAEALAAARRGVGDADPLVRLGALRALGVWPVDRIWPIAAPLLSDPVLAVRIEAAAMLADAPQGQSPEGRTQLARAIDEYVKAQQLDADRPEHRTNLAMLYSRQGRPAPAQAEFEAARALDPGFVPAQVGLAQLLARQGREAEAEQVLRTALQHAPDDADLHHALGLDLARRKRLDDALPELARAAAIGPANPRYAYVWALALNALGRTDEAIGALEANHARHPGDRDTLLALATINRDAGRREAALAWAERLAALDPAARVLVDQLRAPPGRGGSR